MHQLERIEAKLDTILRRQAIMAINEAEFDAALAEFITSLDGALTAIQAKLDEAEVEVDFTDELASLDGAKTRLSEFVAANTTPEVPPVEEVPPVDEGEQPL
jgi:multidrug efflux pump subunit AcrA (membrane-fusion protein)